NMMELMLDGVSNQHQLTAHYLAGFIKSKNLNLKEEEEGALALLTQWDGGHGLEAQTPVLYYRLLSNILEKAMQDELGQEHFNYFASTHAMKQSYLRFLMAENNPWWNDIQTPQNETKQEVIIGAFKKVVKELNEEFGQQKLWQWQNAHHLEHVHPIGRKKPFDRIFNVKATGVPGGNETINSSSFPLGNSSVYNVSYGPAMRRIIDFADTQNSISISPTGQSGYFMSPHYSDQAEMYNHGVFRKQMMKKEEIINGKIGTITFF
ncbi:MAG: penicillin acylase family protein, partial [Bacteroidetes bacterium]|nr:penicillin acylase family protein [Bacteroidota bacterium]